MKEMFIYRFSKFREKVGQIELPKEDLGRTQKKASWKEKALKSGSLQKDLSVLITN